MQLTKRREKSISELSDKALRRRIADARRVIESMPDAPPREQMARHLAVAEAAARDSKTASAELARRQRAEQTAALAPIRRKQLLGKRSAEARALELVGQCADRELRGETLSATRLDQAEGEQLQQLARRRLDGETLDKDEIARYETLAGKAVGDEGMFERKRAEQVEQEKLDKLREAERRHPQAESIVSAVLGDPALFDGLKHRLRPDATVLDELGRERQGVSAVRIYELENIAALHVVLSAIVENGGNPIIVREHGVLPDGLPALPLAALGQLRRNGYIETTQEGTGLRVSLGPRTREIAKRWSITVPAPDDAR